LFKTGLDKIAPLGQHFPMQTVVETRHFAARAEKLLRENERDELVNFIAINPLRGDILIGTGGIRKIRFAVGNKGKSGSVRVIYYYYNGDHPIYLLEIFGKNEKANLSKAERNMLAKLAVEVKTQFRGRKI
jgi:hypothetical protein